VGYEAYPATDGILSCHHGSKRRKSQSPSRRETPIFDPAIESVSLSCVVALMGNRFALYRKFISHGKHLAVKQNLNFFNYNLKKCAAA
jgi:hypothetical protein